MLHVLLGGSVLGIHHYDDPGPRLVSAKLHYCYSNAVFSGLVLLCLPGSPLIGLVRLVPVRLVWFLLLGCCLSCLVGSVVPSAAFETFPCPHSGTRRLELSGL